MYLLGQTFQLIKVPNIGELNSQITKLMIQRFQTKA